MSKEKVSDVLIDKSLSIAKGAEALAERTNDWMVIKSFLKNRLGEIQLTPTQEDKLKRYQFVHNQLSGFRHSEMDVVQQLQSIYKLKPAQAYEDLRDAKEIFAFVFDLKKQFELRIMLDANAAMMFKAKEMNDTKGYATLEKNRVKMVELIQEAEENPGEDFEPHTLIIQFNPVLIGADPTLDKQKILDEINAKRGFKKRRPDIEEAEVINEAD